MEFRAGKAFRKRHPAFDLLARDVPISVPRVNFGWLILLAWAAVSTYLLARNWGLLPLSLHDPDSAMRLVEVRNWLSGQGWFELHMTRVNPPIGYDPHWSRLVDAGLGGLFLLFHTVTDARTAELLMRATWPILWLLPVLTAVSAIAWRLGGRETAVIALVFATLCVPGFYHFTPGNIDHHNVQITLALLTLAASLWSDRKLWAASAAGALTGFALAIGLEAVPLLGVSGAVLTLGFLRAAEGAKAFARYSGVLALTTALSFIVSVSPQHWTHTACDAIAINIATPVIIGSILAFAGAVVLGSRGRLVRGGVVIIGAALASVAFISIEPRCLGGPFAMVDPLTKSEWLSTVREMQPVSVFFDHNPLMVLTLGAFPALALIGVLLMNAKADRRRDIAFIGATMALLLADAFALVQFKGFAYSVWFSIPLMAVVALSFFRTLGIRSVMCRSILILMMSPVGMSVVAYGSAISFGVREKGAWISPARQACFDTSSYAELEKVPKGIILADVNYGPYILALTPHSVVAAPYHRLSRAIAADLEAFSLPPAQAHAIVESTGADYVLICPRGHGVELNTENGKTSLFEQLKSGRSPEWLEPVPLAAGPFALFRVKRR